MEQQNLATQPLTPWARGRRIIGRLAIAALAVSALGTAAYALGRFA